MPVINSLLSVAAVGLDRVELQITDAYGHCNGRVELDLYQCLALSDHLQTLIPLEVEAAVVEEEEPEFDWNVLTKIQIIDKVFEDFEVELNPDDRKATLVQQAQDLEAGV